MPTGYRVIKTKTNEQINKKCQQQQQQTRDSLQKIHGNQLLLLKLQMTTSFSINICHNKLSSFFLFRRSISFRKENKMHCIALSSNSLNLFAMGFWADYFVYVQSFDEELSSYVLTT